MSDKCEHKWVYLDSVKRNEDSGAYQIHWTKTDRFFCEKCLEQKQVTKDEWSRERPAWW